jgi:uncharacterized protein (TIGR00730 family)
LDNEQHSAPAHIRRVTVYASSSNALDERYYDAASRLGSTLARAGLEIVYGGGGVGLMRALADTALAGGAHVHGVIPDFLNTVEHGHKNLSRLEVVTSMRERKHRMIAESDAVISLPGGCGTYEELLEALTLKRLGQFLGPIVLVNTNGYYDRFADLLRHAVSERFMSEAHLEMCSLVEEPEEVIHALHTATPWSSAAREFAAVSKE